MCWCCWKSSLWFFFLVFFVLSGWSSETPSVVSPHELLQKLQLVQHEQRETTNDPSRPCPGLAPRFLGPTQALAECSAPNLSPTTAIKKAAVQIPVSTVDTVDIPFWFFRLLTCEDKGETVKKGTMSPQVMTPQTTAATLSPNLLLSPNAFTRANTCTESTGVTREHSLLFPKLPLQPEVPVLSRKQLQTTLLALIKVDPHI